MKLRFLIISVLIATVAIAQDTAALSAQLNQVKDKLGKDVAFVMYKDGKVQYKKELGKLTVKTQQNIGASSQWLTAALVMIFVQEGKLSLDDKVSQYLPVFEKYYKGYITIRHCLTNFTGIKSDGAKIFQRKKFKTLEEEVNEYASKRDIQTNAGTEFRYSTLGFSIAGRVLEVITKRTFDRIAQERLIRPLGMKNTTFTNEDYDDAPDPAMGARSSAADYANFLGMLLNKGSFNNKQVLTEESVTTLLSQQAEVTAIKLPVKQVEGYSYALGSWIVDKTASEKPAAYASPSFSGTWPILDLCRGYACVIFTKDQSNEPPRDLYFNLKGGIDDAIKSNCN